MRKVAFIAFAMMFGALSISTARAEGAGAAAVAGTLQTQASQHSAVTPVWFAYRGGGGYARGGRYHYGWARGGGAYHAGHYAYGRGYYGGYGYGGYAGPVWWGAGYHGCGTVCGPNGCARACH